MTIPGLVTVPAGFLLGWLGSVTGPRRASGGVPGSGRRTGTDTV
ncbi:hypothetical protein [Streptomyces prasinosporus]